MCLLRFENKVNVNTLMVTLNRHYGKFLKKHTEYHAQWHSYCITLHTLLPLASPHHWQNSQFCKGIAYWRSFDDWISFYWVTCSYCFHNLLTYFCNTQNCKIKFVRNRKICKLTKDQFSPNGESNLTKFLKKSVQVFIKVTKERVQMFIKVQ